MQPRQVATRKDDFVAGSRVIKVAPGEHYVTDDPEEAIWTVLGSCVSACICDPEAGVGGLNHYMLPMSESGVWGGAAGSLRYGNFAMPRLIQDIVNRGGRPDRLEVKLFGAAWMGRDPGRVATGNARFARDYLKLRGLVPIVEQLGGTCARRIIFRPTTGRVLMMEMQEAAVDLAEPGLPAVTRHTPATFA